MNLVNKRVLITRSRAQADEFAAALLAEGAEPIFFPVIEIIPLQDFAAFDQALQQLDGYDWLILTSVHGVHAFFQRLEILDIKKIPASLKIAVVGSKTSQSLLAHGLSADHVPDEYTAGGLFAGLNDDISGKHFLLLQSDLARTVLADQLRSAGGLVDQIVAYQNIAGPADADGLEALRSGVDIVTFTSPSTVKNFVDVLRENGLDPLNLAGAPIFACIGPVTKKAAEDSGFRDLVVPNEHTIAGLVQALGDLVLS